MKTYLHSLWLSKQPQFLSCISFFFAVLLWLYSSTVAAATLTWQPRDIVIWQAPGTTSVHTVTVQINWKADDIAVRLVPELEPWITVNPANISTTASADIHQVELHVSVPLGEPPERYEGVLQLRAGDNQRNLSRPLPISLVITQAPEDSLPPDPGEAGKDTLLGIDSDNDGVRDDIQRYIYLTYPNQPDLQGALVQLSKTYQDILDPKLVEGTEVGIAERVGQAIDCLYFIVGRAGYNYLLDLRAETLNTHERSRKFFEYDKALAGKTFPLPSLPLDEGYKFCNFELNLQGE